MRVGLRAQILIILIGIVGPMVFLLGWSSLQMTEQILLQTQLEADRLYMGQVIRQLQSNVMIGHPDGLHTRLQAHLTAFVSASERALAAGILVGDEVVATMGDAAWTPALSDVDPPAADELIRAELWSTQTITDPVVLLRAAVSNDGEGRRVSVAVMLSLPSADGLGTSRSWTFTVGMLGAFLVLIVGYALLRRVLVAPIRRMRVAAERVAAGDHASRVTLNARNEIGDLADAFNGMLDHLQKSQRELQDKVGALERAQADLQQANQAMVRGEKLASVGRLAAGVAHEVGNPLSALLGLVEYMREEEDLDPEEQADILRRLERELLRIHETIRELLDYSRSGVEGVADADVLDVLDHAEKLVSAQPKFKCVTLSIDAGTDLPRVTANADRLLQVMVNLLMNAADAMDGKGSVTLRVASSRGGVQIAIEDTGPGIPEDAGHQIFEPFFTTKPPGQGTGLGLAICESIVEGFGGEITAENTREGACFRVWIPAIGGEAVS